MKIHFMSCLLETANNPNLYETTVLIRYTVDHPIARYAWIKSDEIIHIPTPRCKV